MGQGQSRLCGTELTECDTAIKSRSPLTVFEQYHDSGEGIGNRIVPYIGKFAVISS